MGGIGPGSRVTASPGRLHDRPTRGRHEARDRVGGDRPAPRRSGAGTRADLVNTPNRRRPSQRGCHIEIRAGHLPCRAMSHLNGKRMGPGGAVRRRGCRGAEQLRGGRRFARPSSGPPRLATVRVCQQESNSAPGSGSEKCTTVCVCEPAEPARPAPLRPREPVVWDAVWGVGRCRVRVVGSSCP
jgi:hypothetical protein